MNIGYLYNFQAYPPKGGNHIHALELIQGFLEKGHSVFTVNDPTMPGTINFDCDDDSLKQFIKNIDILYIRIDGRFICDLPAIKKCMQLDSSPPIVWEINSPANESLAYSWLSGRNLDEPEGILRKGRRLLHATSKLPGIWAEEILRKKLAQKVNAAICVSNSLGNYASHDLGIKNVKVLPNGGPLLSIDEIEERRSKGKFGKFNVLYCGSAMYPWQGLDYLAQVINLAKTEAPDMKFVLAVNQRKAGLPVSKNVIVLENLNREKIIDAICTADACVSLHPKYSWAKYGFHNSPMKLFEYMACARPSVASKHGQMAEIIKDDKDGLLCENTPQDILGKLVFLQNNPQRANEIGNNAWCRVRDELSWNRHVVPRTLQLFEETINGQT